MNIECVVEKLERIIQVTNRITRKDVTLPILQTLFLKAENNLLTVKATNLDIGVELTLPVKVKKKGEVAVPGGILTAFLSSLSGDHKLHISEEGGNLILTTDTTKTHIKTFPTEDFPQIPYISPSHTLTLETKDIINGFQSVGFSASTSSMKPELASIYLYQKDNTHLMFVATDSFRLAERVVTTQSSFSLPGSQLIPAKNIPEISRVLEVMGGTADIIIENNQIAFSSDNVYITSRTVDGTFPDYKQIIPSSFTTEVTVLKEDLINALKVANIFSNTLHQVKIEVQPSENVFRITTHNADVGETVNTIPATLEGEDITATFNYKYINECFSSITTDSVTLKFNPNSSPLVISPVSDTSFLYLVMPMNT